MNGDENEGNVLLSAAAPPPITNHNHGPVSDVVQSTIQGRLAPLNASIVPSALKYRSQEMQNAGAVVERPPRQIEKSRAASRICVPWQTPPWHLERALGALGTFATSVW